MNLSRENSNEKNLLLIVSINSNNIQLSTNRQALFWVENTIQINGNTVYRQILRLMDAGVISEKANHGSQMNFDLFITT